MSTLEQYLYWTGPWHATKWSVIKFSDESDFSRDRWMFFDELAGANRWFSSLRFLIRRFKSRVAVSLFKNRWMNLISPTVVILNKKFFSLKKRGVPKIKMSITPVSQKNLYDILESISKILSFQPLATVHSSMKSLHLIDHWEPFLSMTQNSISTRTFWTLFYWKWTEIKMRKVNYTQSKLFFIVVLPRFPEKTAPRPTSTFKHFI